MQPCLLHLRRLGAQAHQAQHARPLVALPLGHDGGRRRGQERRRHLAAALRAGKRVLLQALPGRVAGQLQGRESGVGRDGAAGGEAPSAHADQASLLALAEGPPHHTPSRRRTHATAQQHDGAHATA